MKMNTRSSAIRISVLMFLLPAAVLQASAFPAGEKIVSETNIRYGRAGTQDLLLDVYYPPASGPASAEHFASSTASTTSIASTTSTASTRSTSSAGVSAALPRRPAIVFVHGGGWSAGDKNAFAPFAEHFARHGFVGFSVGYRLVRPLTNKWPSQIDDLQLAVRWIRANADRFNIDPDRIGGMGGSAGGHLVSLLGLIDTHSTGGVQYSEHSSRLQCVVNLFGPSDFTSDFPTTSVIGSVQALVDGFLGVPAKQAPEIARDASPIFHVNRDTPFLIFQGDKDALVPVDQSIRFHEALEKAGADSTLVVMKDEGHGLNPGNHKRFIEQSLEFYKKHLLRGENPGDSNNEK